MNTAVFFEIVNSGRKPDTLYNVTSDLAKLTEVHQSFEKDGQMGMRKVPLLVIPAKSTVYFKPGSYHVMLIKLKKDMKEGNIEEVSLHFKQAGEIKVKSVVKI
jgi:copper(I)-binding protein